MVNRWIEALEAQGAGYVPPDAHPGYGRTGVEGEGDGSDAATVATTAPLP